MAGAERDDVILWVRQAVQGDGAAYARLVRHYHGLVYGFLFRMHPDHHTVQDLIQESFIRAWEGLDGLRQPVRFKSWLFTIARNQLRDHLRRASVQREVSRDTWHDVGQEDRTLTRWARRHAQRDLVTHALAQLTETQREAVVLRYFHDMSLMELAEVQNVPLSTAKTRLYAGLRRLSQRLQADQDPDPRGARRSEDGPKACGGGTDGGRRA